MTELFKPLTGGPLIASVAAATPAGPIATATAAMGTLPPALADLTAGTVLAGVVVERSRGQVLLKTDKGMLQVQTNLALKLGASVVLEVQSVGAQIRLAILSVDQRTPSVSEQEALALDIAVQTGTERETATSAPAGRAPAPPLVGRTMTATVVGPPDPRLAGNIVDPTIPTLLRRLIAISALARVAADSTPRVADTPLPPSASPASSATRTDRAAPAPLPGAGATGRIVTSSDPAEPLVIPSAEELEAALKMLPAPAREIVAALLDDGSLGTPTVPPATRGAASSTPQDTPPNGARGPDTPASPTATERDATAPAVKTIAIRILAQSPAPGAAAPLRPHVATQSDAITLVGTAVAEDATGTEIATPIGRLRLPIPAALPQGTRITFEILSRTADEPAAPTERAAEALMRPTVETTRDWSAVRDVAARWPEAADVLFPKAGQPLGPALLAFVAAVRGGGNLKAWLGSHLAAAAEEVPDKKELIARLGRELSAAARSAASAEVDGWRTIAVPVIDVGRMSELRFRFRKRDRRDGGADDGGRRFVVQATLSALGPLQLDGTVRERHLDLVVRTARALPAPMRRDISELFARSLAGTDYRGEIRFRNDALGDVAPGTSGHSGVVV